MTDDRAPSSPSPRHPQAAETPQPAQPAHAAQSVQDILASIRTLIADGKPPAEQQPPTITVAEAFGLDADTAGAGSEELLELARRAGGHAPGRDRPPASSPASHTGEPEAAAAGQKTLEQLVTDLLRPMLAAWVEANAPALARAILAEQISEQRKQTPPQG